MFPAVIRNEAPAPSQSLGWQALIAEIERPRVSYARSHCAGVPLPEGDRIGPAGSRLGSNRLNSTRSRRTAAERGSPAGSGSDHFTVLTCWDTAAARRMSVNPAVAERLDLGRDFSVCSMVSLGLPTARLSSCSLALRRSPAERFSRW
jgi:hypothetical protein